MTSSGMNYNRSGAASMYRPRLTTMTVLLMEKLERLNFLVFTGMKYSPVGLLKTQQYNKIV
jgi:hypothetical protein